MYAGVVAGIYMCRGQATDCQFETPRRGVLQVDRGSNLWAMQVSAHMAQPSNTREIEKEKQIGEQTIISVIDD